VVGEAVDLNTFVISLGAVRASIEILRGSPIHQYFPAYLHLRQQGARQGTWDAIAPKWNEVGHFLDVPGSESGRPYLRPFGTRDRDPGSEWLNRNLAGSYAESSLRQGQPPLKVVQGNGNGTFSMKEKHWELARLHLCSGEKVSVLALAGYYFRNYGFVSGAVPTSANLIEEFRSTFGYSPEDEEEFQYLFNESWDGPDVTWFEEWSAAPLETGNA
jgi:hypothetical protein